MVSLQNGADPSKSDFYGQPPLQYATEYGHVEVVSLLIQSGQCSSINKLIVYLMEVS